MLHSGDSLATDIKCAVADENSHGTVKLLLQISLKNAFGKAIADYLQQKNSFKTIVSVARDTPSNHSNFFAS